MRRCLKWLGIALIGLVISVIALYVVLIRPIAREEADLKPVLAKSAESFLSCIYSSLLETCYHDDTTESFKAAADFQRMVSMMETIKKKLGPRISAVLEDNTFNLNVNFGAGGTDKLVRFVMKPVYQNDPIVTESFVFAYDKKTKTYKVHSFNVNSTRFLQ